MAKATMATAKKVLRKVGLYKTFTSDIRKFVSEFYQKSFNLARTADNNNISY